MTHNAQQCLLDVKCFRIREGHNIYTVEHDAVFAVSSVDYNDSTFTLSNGVIYSWANTETHDVYTSSLGVYLVPTLA